MDKTRRCEGEKLSARFAQRSLRPPCKRARMDHRGANGPAETVELRPPPAIEAS